MSDAEKMAAAAWDRYDSTVRLGGTPEQRAWAFAHALEAEERSAEHDRHHKANAPTEELHAFPGRSV